MTHRILAGLACVAGVAGYLITPQLTPYATARPAVHCQTEYGHDRGQASHFAKVCQP